jgi:hypothetical protein
MAKVNDAPHQDPRFIHDPNVGPPKAYYMPHPGPYAYYPGMPVPPLPEGAMPYYPPPLAPPTSSPPSAEEQTPPSAGSNISNLPPPEIARLIPCRYFPACRYGASCIFAHPQGPYYPRPMPPPAQFPSPYEQPPYPPNFYPMPAPPPPPQFQPNGVPHPHHLSPVSPQSATQPVPPPPPQFVSQRNNSEIVPPLQIPFNSPGAPVPGPGPYGPMSPVSPSYPHPGQLSVPLSVPPPPQAHAPTGPQPSSAPYPQSAPPSVPHQRYPASSEQNGAQKPLPHEGFGHRGDRRASGGPGFRRPSFGGNRKPPCLFFPSGRCRNGYVFGV